MFVTSSTRELKAFDLELFLTKALSPKILLVHFELSIVNFGLVFKNELLKFYWSRFSLKNLLIKKPVYE